MIQSVITVLFTWLYMHLHVTFGNLWLPCSMCLMIFKMCLCSFFCTHICTFIPAVSIAVHVLTPNVTGLLSH